MKLGGGFFICKGFTEYLNNLMQVWVVYYCVELHNISNYPKHNNN